ncbi:hypothetical protein SELMODRAFT_426864 [Selaginella moellendorffii]|uniref:Pentacotripeptide-repeat region of PRORP domain-containing protein n=1 Tax=Selaginella moellendorffii TaxID=88036 RepID=D8SXR5_SELML|nr:hypothetical protein SELMODRAFT_426864 [Selaginella moellendorffii]
MERHDIVSWTTLMLEYVQVEQAPAALDLFSRMQQVQGLVLDAPTYAVVLWACGSSMALETRRAIHQQIHHAEREAEVVIVNSLLGFYGQSGCMAEAREVFDSVASAGCDAMTWNMIIAGYCHQGDIASSSQALQEDAGGSLAMYFRFFSFPSFDNLKNSLDAFKLHTFMSLSYLASPTPAATAPGFKHRPALHFWHTPSPALPMVLLTHCAQIIYCYK